jgi:hypothetical protein
MAYQTCKPVDDCAINLIPQNKGRAEPQVREKKADGSSANALVEGDQSNQLFQH